MLTRSSQQLNAVPNQTIINNMYRIANIVLFVLAIFVVMGCSCSKTLCERNIQDDILNIDKFRKQSKKEYRYIEEDSERLFANSAAVYPDTLYRQQYTSLQGYFYGETGFDNSQNVEYIKSLLTAEIYNYCLQEYMCRLINENVSEQEQLSL